MYWKYASALMFVVFAIWARTELKLMSRREENKEEAFWKRERESNNVRRKPIDHLDYVHIPESLPFDLHADNLEIQECIKIINGLINEPILNLTGFSNTDLKIKYGTANITTLSIADQNYTLMATTLQKWADELIKLSCDKEAYDILKFLVSTNVDIGKTYRLLGKFYLKEGDTASFDELVKTAQNTNSMNTKYIVSSLKDMKKDYDL
ncbi:MAG: hypothetical protein MJ123_09670 [Lachnospiraceae bacterium]|nr:hypothetical protein [Lachnospiraceae bacterium]